MLTGENVTGVAAGRYSTYAITASGALFSFGLDACSNGGVVPPVTDAHLPRRVALQSAVVAISVGYVHWAALTSDGAVFTCDTGDDGYAGTLANKRAPNADGELGRELGIGAHLPGQVTGLLAGKRIVSVAAGRSHTLAVDADGRLYGWGNNQAGQLGVEAGHSAAVPALVSAPPLDMSPVSAVAAGEYFSLAALAGGGLLGWGANGNGQLGRGIDASPEERHVAPAHLGAAGQPPLHVMSLAAGYQHAAAVVAVAPASGTQKGAASLDSSSPVTLVPASGSLDGIPGPAAPPADIWAAHRAALPPRHADIVASSPDVFAMLPTDTPPLLPSIASPCWHAAAEALGAHTDVRCLPLIHVLGVSKCGTTDLYKRLAKHPDFVDSLNKGPHFWDESPPGPAGQFASYVALFDELARRVGSGANATPPSPAARLVSCDASSNTYTASGVYRRGHTPEGDVTVGELLLDAVPYGRFILMLRNPTDRLLSAFHYYRRMFGPRDQKPATAADFQAHVAESLGAWGTCLAGHGGNVTPCVRRFEPQQLIKGMYSEFLWDWSPRLRPGTAVVESRAAHVFLALLAHRLTRRSPPSLPHTPRRPTAGAAAGGLQRGPEAPFGGCVQVHGPQAADRNRMGGHTQRAGRQCGRPQGGAAGPGAAAGQQHAARDAGNAGRLLRAVQPPPGGRAGRPAVHVGVTCMQNTVETMRAPSSVDPRHGRVGPSPSALPAFPLREDTRLPCKQAGGHHLPHAKLLRPVKPANTPPARWMEGEDDLGAWRPDGDGALPTMTEAEFDELFGGDLDGALAPLR